MKKLMSVSLGTALVLGTAAVTVKADEKKDYRS